MSLMRQLETVEVLAKLATTGMGTTFDFRIERGKIRYIHTISVMSSSKGTDVQSVGLGLLAGFLQNFAEAFSC